MKYYLAYGSNLSVAQMLHRCPSAVYVGRADIPDHRLLFKGSRSGNYLTMEPMKGRTLPVLVWKVTEEEEKALDRYEGYPGLYKKETMTVTLRSLAERDLSMEIEAFVYVMDKRRKVGPPTHRYYMTCMEGYFRFGFDPAILEKALEESRGGRRR